MKNVKRIFAVFFFVSLLISCSELLPFMFAPAVTTDSQFSNAEKLTFTWKPVEKAMKYLWKVGDVEEWFETTETSVTVDAPLSGICKFQVKSHYKSKKGNITESTVSSCWVNIDRTAPEKPIVSVVAVTCNPKPQWSWSTPEGADFFVYTLDDNPEVKVSSFTTLFVPTEDLTEGSHVFKLKAGDRAGNWSDWAESTVMVDLSVLPEPQWNMAGVATLTKNVRPTWKWVSDLNAFRYRVQLDGTYEDRWDLFPAATNQWTPDFNLPDGAHVLYVQVQNAVGGEAGNWSSSAQFTLTVDNTPPAIPQISGDDVVGHFTPEWSWNVPEGTAQFQLYFNGDPLPLVDSSVLSYKVPAGVITADGEYVFGVQALDALGNASDINSFTTRVDQSGGNAPKIEVIEAIYIEGRGYFSNNTKPTFSWTIPTGGHVKNFYYRIDSDPASSDPKQWKKLPGSIFSLKRDKSFDPGVHLFELAAENDLDVLSSVSSYELHIDLTAPSAPIVDPIGTTGDLKPLFTWNENSDVVLYQIRLEKSSIGSSGNAWISLDATLPSFSNSYRVLSPMEGAEGDGVEYRFEIRARNRIGNWSAISTLLFKISTSIPDAPILVCESGERTKNTTPTWSWTLPPGVTVTKVGYRLDSNAEIISTSDPFPLTYTAETALETAGNQSDHKFYVRIWDNKGIPSAAAVSKVTIDLKPPLPPVVDGVTPTGEKRPQWNWSHPAYSDVARFAWKVDDDSGSPANLSDNWEVSDDNTTRKAVSSVDLGDGSHTMYVRACDSLGNWSTSGSKSITVDTTALDAPSVTIAASDLYNGGNPIDGVLYVNTKTPTFTWNHDQIGQQLGGSAVIVKYRFSTNGGYSWKVVEGEIPTSFMPQFPLGEGNRTCEVQVLNQVGNWSPSGTIAFSVVTEKPQAPIVTSAAPTTSDTTPRWSWNISAADIVQFRYKFLDGSSWTTVGNGVHKYIPTSPLTPDTYTLEVQAQNAVGLWSDSGSYSVTINLSAPNMGLPKAITINSVSKGAIKDGVRIEWTRDEDAEFYQVFRVTAAEYLANHKLGTLISPDIPENQLYFYDKTAAAKTGESFYYRVQGKNGDGVGPKSDLSSSSAEKSRGCALAVFKEPTGSLANTGEMSLQWTRVDGATQYQVCRTSKYASRQTDPASLPYFYLASDGSWKAMNGSESPENFKSISDLSVLDSGFDSVIDFWYYRIRAINENSKNVGLYLSEGQVGAGYHISDWATPAAIFLAPRNLAGWLAASDNDYSTTSAYGKVRLTVTVPQAYRPYINDFNFEVNRTYRYGGGYQGHNAVSGTNKGNSDLSSHTSLTNPDPTSGPWKKTITLEYPFNGSDFSNGVLSRMDTLYDVDEDGKKLIAVVNTSFESETAKPWYERTQDFIDNNPQGVTYQKVPDLDGEPSEMEWHYLKWDWVIRKAMYHSGNDEIPSSVSGRNRFDINLMTRADYTLTVKSSVAGHDDVTFTDTEHVVYGWPALTPREFGFLAMILREISFYRIKVSYYDEVEEMGLGAAGMAKQDEEHLGACGGKICKKNGGLNGVSGASADVYTEGGPNNGISEFPGCEIVFSWKPMYIKFGGPHICLDGKLMYIYTPKWSGSIKITADLYGGTYYHGLASRSHFDISYASFTNYADISTLMPSNATSLGSYRMGNEYLSMGLTWDRAKGNNPNNYYDRYTSVGWTYPGLSYPGF